jgi:uncharacterized protein (TIGR02186 family)
MKARLLLLLAALLALVAPAAAQQANLIASLSRDQVLIQSNFTGETLALFGTFTPVAGTATPYDIVVTVRGPRGAVTVRRKQQFGPFWLNLDNRRYIAIPAFIAVLSNRDIEAIASAEVREDLRIGTSALIPAQTAARGNDPEFRASLQRIRENEGLFYEDDEGVRMISPTVFQARIELPGIAPLGRYDVDVALFNAGALVATQSLNFIVTKSGAEQIVARAAFIYPLAYGIVTTLIALFFGWLASVIFRRD